MEANVTLSDDNISLTCCFSEGVQSEGRDLEEAEVGLENSRQDYLGISKFCVQPRCQAPPPVRGGSNPKESIAKASK